MATDQSQQDYEAQLASMRATRDSIASSPMGHTEGVKAQIADIDRRIAEFEAQHQRDFYSGLGEEYGQIPEDPNTQRRAGELYEPRGKEIDRGMYDAGKSTAEGYSRRGIGGSGYATAAQGQIAQAAAGERARVRGAAFDEAIAEGRQSLVGEAQLTHMGDPFLAQMYADAQRRYDSAVARGRSNDDFMRDFILEGAGRGIGYAVGGPAGAGAGGSVAGGGGGGVSGPAELLQGPNGELFWSDGTPFEAY